MSMSREAFVGRVSEALGRSRAKGEATPPPVVRDEVVRLVEPGGAVVDTFAERAEAIGMHVYRCSEATLAETFGGLVKDLGLKHVATGSTLVDADALQRAGVESVVWREDRSMSALYDADAGINDAEAAFADSGTLVVTGDASGGRGLYLVPPVHIAVLREADVLADQLDYMRPLRDVSPGELPAGRTFITGPSKTADIEGVLVTGVHGPGAVHILLVS